MFVYVSLYYFLQTDLGKQYIKKIIQSSTYKYTNCTLDIGNIKKLTPLHLAIEDIVLSQEGAEYVNIRHVSLSLSLSSMIYRKIIINNLIINNLLVKTNPIESDNNLLSEIAPLSIKGSVECDKNSCSGALQTYSHQFTKTKINFKGPYDAWQSFFSLEKTSKKNVLGNICISSNNVFMYTNFILSNSYTITLNKINARIGTLNTSKNSNAKIVIAEKRAKIDFSSQKIYNNDGQSIKNIVCHTDVNITENIEGIISADFQVDEIPIRLTLEYVWDSFLHLKNISLSNANNIITGNIFINNDKLIKGNISVDAQQLASVIPIKGDIKGTIVFDIKKNSQSIDVSLYSSKMHYKDLFLQDINITSDINTKTTVVFDKGSINYIRLPQTTLRILSDKLYFEIFSTNDSKFSYKTSGIFSKDYKVIFNEFIANYKSIEIQLKSPFSINDTYEISPIEMSIGSGYLYFAKNQKNMNCDLKDIPLQLINDFHFTAPIRGYISGNAHIIYSAKKCSGSVDLELNKIVLEEHSIKPLPPMSAKFMLDIGNKITFESIISDGLDKIKTKLLLPATIYTNPFIFEIESELPMEGSIEGKFNLLPITKLLSKDSNITQGKLETSLKVNGTLNVPKASGKLFIKNGSVENSYTGAIFNDINIEIAADKNALIINKCHIQNNGTIIIEGKAYIDVKKSFPFSFNANINKSNLVNYDNASAQLQGQISIYGNLSKVTINGNLNLVKATIKIPNKIPLKVPTLDVIYDIKNNEYDLNETNIMPKIDLNVTVCSNGKTFVNGRGLTSEWGGNLSITNPNNTLSINGTLKLVKGKFDFTGKSFTLSRGNLTFSGPPKTDSYIDITAFLDIDNTRINAIMQGPLTSPRLSFQSIPTLPIDDIIAKILFNKNTKQITPFQAVQLAQTISTISGGSFAPNILDSLRKGLHLDQLNITSEAKSSSMINENMRLQIGKQITNKIFISTQKNIREDIHEFSIEANIIKHFKARASVNSNADAKFQFNWRKDY